MSTGTKVKGTLSLVFLAPIVFWAMTHFMPGVFVAWSDEGEWPNPHADHEAYKNPYSVQVVWEPPNREVKILFSPSTASGTEVIEQDKSPWNASFEANVGDVINLGASQRPINSPDKGPLTCKIFKGGKLVKENTITDFGMVTCSFVAT